MVPTTSQEPGSRWAKSLETPPIIKSANDPPMTCHAQQVATLSHVLI